MPDTIDHHDQTTRLPRHVYRKQLKLKKRRQRRQSPYLTHPSTSINQNPAPEEPTSNSSTIEQDTALYLQQKAQWEAKEREHNLINEARKKVLETEKKARELAMEKWHASLRNLPIPTPPGYSSQDESRSSNSLQRSSIHKKFVSSGHMERRRTYRDKFELTKKSV